MPIPLCGPAGIVGHKMLIWADIIEGDFILTNIVKSGTFTKEGRYRPPTEDEILEERDTVIKEIAKVNPKLILTFGKEALWSLCYHDKAAIDEMTLGPKHGIMHKLTIDINKYLELNLEGQNLSRTYSIIPLYHPSAILRDETGERGFKERVTQTMLANKEYISNILGRLML